MKFRLYNLYRACKALCLKENSDEVLAYVKLLGIPGSYCYNPVGREIMSDMMSAISRGRKKNRVFYTRLFFGQYETLVAQTYSLLCDSNMVNQFRISAKDANSQNYMMDRLRFQETVNNLIRNRKDNTAYVFFDDFHPQVNVLSHYAKWHINSAAIHYVADVDDPSATIENLRRKAEYFKKANGSRSADYIVASTLVDCLSQAASQPKNNSEMFALLISQAASFAGLDEKKIKAITSTRNKAVHRDKKQAINYVAVSSAIKILIASKPLEHLDNEQMQNVKSRLSREKLPFRILSMVSILIFSTFVAYVVALLISLFVNNTKAEQIRLDNTNSSELNAKWDEAMGTKDVPQLLEMQENIRTAKEIFDEAKEKTLH